MTVDGNREKLVSTITCDTCKKMFLLLIDVVVVFIFFFSNPIKERMTKRKAFAHKNRIRGLFQVFIR